MLFKNYFGHFKFLL